MRSDDDRRKIGELGFKKWLTDVLWYHYKWIIMGSLGVLAVVGMLIGLTVSKKDNDAIVLLAVSKLLGTDRINSLKLAIGDVVGDINGDGEIIISINQLLLNSADGDYDPSVQSNESGMLATFLQKDIVLYLFDQTNLNIYASPESGRFNIELADEYGGENGAVSLGDTELFRELELTGEDKLFACFKVKTFNVSETDEEYYAVARLIMDGLLKR